MRFFYFCAWFEVLVLRFKKSKKYCVLAAKIVKSRDANCQRIRFRPRLAIFAHFSNSNFQVIIPEKKDQRINWLKIGWYLFFFNSFNLI